jgi:hypothetical protein
MQRTSTIFRSISNFFYRSIKTPRKLHAQYYMIYDRTRIKYRIHRRWSWLGLMYFHCGRVQSHYPFGLPTFPLPLIGTMSDLESSWPIWLFFNLEVYWRSRSSTWKFCSGPLVWLVISRLLCGSCYVLFILLVSLYEWIPI